MKYAGLAGLAGVLCLGLVPCAASAAIELGINGDAQVGSNYVYFGQYPTGAPYTPAPGYGTYIVSLVNGVFAANGVTTGEAGMIQSIVAVPGPVSLAAPYLTFDTGGSNLELFATNIPAGNYGAFDLTDTPDGAVGSFDLEGYVYDTTTAKKLGDFTMVASATFTGQTVAQVLASVPLDTPFSATFSFMAVPEPASWALMLLGIGGVGLGLRGARRERAGTIA
jgi:PEP-CTERM motif